jgi:outer membrane protein OmpA-like peptidoglycan-associated protein
MNRRALIAFFVIIEFTGTAMAQDTGSTKPAPVAGQSTAAANAPTPLYVYFDSGSSVIRDEDVTVLNQASRAYNEGKPIVMILTGGADRTGTPTANLLLSQRRAIAVLNGLLGRGIPADRFQVLAKGETDLAVPTDPNVAEGRNRRVEITWR